MRTALIDGEELSNAEVYIYVLYLLGCIIEECWAATLLHVPKEQWEISLRKKPLVWTLFQCLGNKAKSFLSNRSA